MDGARRGYLSQTSSCLVYWTLLEVTGAAGIRNLRSTRIFGLPGNRGDYRFIAFNTWRSVTRGCSFAWLWLCGGRVAIQFFRLSFLGCEFEIVVVRHPI